MVVHKSDCTLANDVRAKKRAEIMAKMQAQREEALRAQGVDVEKVREAEDGYRADGTKLSNKEKIAAFKEAAEADKKRMMANAAMLSKKQDDIRDRQLEEKKEEEDRELIRKTEAMEAKTAELSEKELKQRVKMQEEVDKLRAFAHAHDDEVEEDGSNHEMSKSEKKAEDKANKMQEEIFKKFGDVSDGPRKLKPWESAPRALVGGTVGKLLGGAKQLTLTMTGLGGDLLLEGDLLKLGGRKKDKWEKRHLKCSTEGLVWSKALSVKEGVNRKEMISVSKAPGWDFKIETSVKQGKVYRFAAANQEEQDNWIRVIQSMIDETGEPVETEETEEAEPAAEPADAEQIS